MNLLIAMDLHLLEREKVFQIFHHLFFEQRKKKSLYNNREN